MKPNTFIQIVIACSMTMLCSCDIQQQQQQEPFDIEWAFKDLGRELSDIIDNQNELIMLYRCNCQEPQQQSGIEAECELSKSEQNDIIENRNRIAEIKEEYIKAAKKQNERLDTGQAELDPDLNFEDVYSGIVSGIRYVADCAVTNTQMNDDTPMSDTSIFLYNANAANQMSLMKLRVVMYEALSYKDKSYIPLYKKAVDELVETNKNTYYD